MAFLNETAAELAALAARCKVMGETGLQRELQTAVQRAADPIPGRIRADLKPKLPDRYAEVLDADLAISIRTNTRPGNPGVFDVATTRGLNGVQRRRIRRLNQGILAHPLFGDRKKWYDQPVAPGWFTQPNEDSAPRFRAELDEALRRVREKLEGRYG